MVFYTLNLSVEFMLLNLAHSNQNKRVVCLLEIEHKTIKYPLHRVYTMKELLDRVNFRINLEGEALAVAIAQDYKSNEVLMSAFINREALIKTLETKKAHYYSTSRKKLWMKGEESGNVQRVKEVRIDCDGDAVLLKVEQKRAACHEGYRSCFFRAFKKGKLVIDSKRIFEPKEVYK